jgi:GT2 family glycosyltransferase
VKLSVIVPAYNNLPDVMTCLNSLFMLRVSDVEFLVQDDASSDYLGLGVIPQVMASCQRNEVNLGFGGNCNAGAARASGDVLFFVNQDCFAVDGWSNGWDAHLLEAFNDGNVGVVGARLLFPDGSVQNAGGGFDGGKAPYHRYLGYSNPHCEEVATPCEVQWTTGAALAVRRDLFEKVGGFDPVYGRGYFEDVDTCLKIRQLGFKVWYEPRCTLIHKVGQSGGNPAFRQNALTFIQRWRDTIEADTNAVKVRYW